MCCLRLTVCGKFDVGQLQTYLSLLDLCRKWRYVILIKNDGEIWTERYRIRHSMDIIWFISHYKLLQGCKRLLYIWFLTCDMREKARRDALTIFVPRQDGANLEEPHRFTKHQLVIRAVWMPIVGAARWNEEVWAKQFSRILSHYWTKGKHVNGGWINVPFPGWPDASVSLRENPVLYHHSAGAELCLWCSEQRVMTTVSAIIVALLDCT